MQDGGDRGRREEDRGGAAGDRLSLEMISSTRFAAMDIAGPRRALGAKRWTWRQ